MVDGLKMEWRRARSGAGVRWLIGWLIGWLMGWLIGWGIRWKEDVTWDRRLFEVRWEVGRAVGREDTWGGRWGRECKIGERAG